VTAQAVKSGDLPVKGLAFTGFGCAITGSSGNMGVIPAYREIGAQAVTACSRNLAAKLCAIRGEVEGNESELWHRLSEESVTASDA
jgi:hypothetical protein